MTHVHVVPLRGLMGAASGMMSLEVECRPAIGAPFVWGDCASDLQLCADVSAPYLAGLPLRALRDGATIEVDPLLPVVGASMRPLVELFLAHVRAARGTHSRDRADGRGQIADRAVVPRTIQTAGQTVRSARSLRGAGVAADGGALRMEEGRVHRRGQRQARLSRAGRRRHGLHRRDRQSVAASAIRFASRARRADLPRARRRTARRWGRRALHRGDQRPPRESRSRQALSRRPILSHQRAPGTAPVARGPR